MAGKVKVWRVLAVVAVVIAVSVAVAYFKGALQPFGIYRPSNALMVIAPYKHAGTWVFDDAAVGLKQEPFVSGIPEMIDDMVKDIPDAEKGFRLLFSTQEFPGYTHKLVWRRGDDAGNWYYCKQYDKEGWLCPGLFRYYQKAPKEIYVKAEKKIEAQPLRVPVRVRPCPSVFVRARPCLSVSVRVCPCVRASVRPCLSVSVRASPANPHCRKLFLFQRLV